jgi:hypothetical protein
MGALWERVPVASRAPARPSSPSSLYTRLICVLSAAAHVSRLASCGRASRRADRTCGRARPGPRRACGRTHLAGAHPGGTPCPGGGWAADCPGAKPLQNQKQQTHQPGGGVSSLTLRSVASLDGLVARCDAARSLGWDSARPPLARAASRGHASAGSATPSGSLDTMSEKRRAKRGGGRTDQPKPEPHRQEERASVQEPAAAAKVPPLSREDLLALISLVRRARRAAERGGV